jgi:hypothetical protein
MFDFKTALSYHRLLNKATNTVTDLKISLIVDMAVLMPAKILRVEIIPIKEALKLASY